MDHFLFVSNRDSQDYYSSNRPDFFTINCEQSICLPGNWKVAITEINVVLAFETRARPNYLGITVDFCSPSYVSGNYRQILRKLQLEPDSNLYSVIFSKPYYFKVNVPEINKFMVSVINEDLALSGLAGELSFTLHLKKQK